MPPSAWNRDASPQLLAEIDADSTLNVIDTHTAGEPTRILLCADGFAPLDGETMLKRQIGATEHWEMMRRRLIHEPRGHGDMFGAVVLPPARQDCDAGVLFFDTGGFLAMCVHGSIAVSRVLVALGHRNSFLRLDTAAGPIESRVDPSSYGVSPSITVRNVPSFVTALDQQVIVDGRGITFDIAFGGNFAALIDAKSMGFEISSESAQSLRVLGYNLLTQINRTFAIEHPTQPELRGVALAYFYQIGEDATKIRNLVVFGNKQIDRSPCGTGSSAMLAALVSRGRLAPLQKCTIHSTLGSLFAVHVDECRDHALGLQKFPIFDPYITARSYITGINQLVFERADPYSNGFLY